MAVDARPESSPANRASTYSREVTLPKTKREGLINFVQIIVNRLEAGEADEALLQAVDLIDSISSGIYDDAITDPAGASAMAREMETKSREMAAQHAETIIKAGQEGYERGVAAEKERMTAALGLLAAS